MRPLHMTHGLIEEEMQHHFSDDNFMTSMPASKWRAYQPPFSAQSNRQI
jgi:hypothetical protein